MLLEPGLTGTATMTVDADDTAESLGTGAVPVLGTPRVIALAEEATVAALLNWLEPGQTSVCMRIQVDHLAPTAVGSVVTADATLEKVQGRRLIFTVSANDERGLVAAGKVTRVVVVTDRFLEKTSG